MMNRVIQGHMDLQNKVACPLFLFSFFFFDPASPSDAYRSGLVMLPSGWPARRQQCLDHVGDLRAEVMECDGCDDELHGHSSFQTMFGAKARVADLSTMRRPFSEVKRNDVSKLQDVVDNK